MPGYFKLKRPFATKTKNLPEGEVKECAECFGGIEKNLVKAADTARKLKRLLKEYEPLLAKYNKSNQDSKLLEKIKKKQDEFTTLYTIDFLPTLTGNYGILQNKTITDTLPDLLGEENADKIKIAANQTMNTIKAWQTATIAGATNMEDIINTMFPDAAK